MVDITYTIMLDIAKTAFASGALDVTGRTLGFQCAEGCSMPYELVAQPARLILTLDNADGAFFPDGGGTYAGTIRRGLMVRVQMTYITTQTLWTGWIDTWQFEIHPLSQRPVVIITAIDRSYELSESEYGPRLEYNIRTDAEIQRVLDDTLALPYTSSSAGHAVFDYDVFGTGVFGDNSAYCDFETGLTTLDYAGTPILAPQERLNARQYIEMLVAAEAEGLFWWSGRAGKFRFFNRRHYLHYASIQATVGDSSAAPLLSAGPALYGDVLINRASIAYTIRATGAANSVLYEMDEPLVLYGNAERQFTAQYRDPDVPGAQVYGVDMVYPLPYTDYAVNQISDGSGLDYMQYASVAVEFGASSARVTLRNMSNTLPIWFTMFRLRGTPLTTYDVRTVTRSHATSIATHGMWTYSGNLDLINDADLAEQYAAYLVNQRAVPIMRLAEVTFNANHNATLAAYARDIDVGDRIRVNLTNYGNTGHDRQYIVVGIRYGCKAGADVQLPGQLLTTWVLRPADRIMGALFDSASAQFDAATFTL